MSGTDDSGLVDERAHFAPEQDARIHDPGRSATFGADAGDRPRRTVPRLRRSVAGFHLSVIHAFRTEAARGAAFLCAPVCLGAGAVIYFSLVAEPALIPILIGCAAAAIGSLLTRGRPIPHLVLTAVFLILLGMAAGRLETWRAQTPMMGSNVATRMTGRVVRVEHRADGRFRLTLDVVATEHPRLSYPPERVRATARGIPAGLSPGEGVKGLVFLLAPSGPVRPQGYDFSFQSYFSGNGAVGFFMGNPARVPLAAPATIVDRLRAGVEDLRQRLAAHIQSVIGGPEGAVAAALIAGVRSGIPEDVTEALRASGLAHILSISGLHMALVALTIMTGARTMFACFPGFASRHPTRKYAAALALPACAFYLLLAGADVAASRSFIMLAIMLVAVLFDRAAISMRNLAIAAFVLVAISPHEVVGPSFQMSFAATAALIAGYCAWGEWRSRHPPKAASADVSQLRALSRRLVSNFGGLAMTSVIAGLATGLYAVWHFQRLATIGLVGNLGAMPVVSTLVMPFAVLSMILLPFGLDGPALWVMGKGVAIMIAVARWVAAHSPNDATGAIPASGVVLVTLALLVATISTTRLRLAALVFLVAGGILILDRRLPDALVSEDGKIVVLREGKEVYANVTRADGFVMDNWLRALGVTSFARPEAKDAKADVSAPTLPGSGFVCEGGTCVAQTASGAVVASTDDPEAAWDLCAKATLIVLQDATARDICGHGGPPVVTTRNLARRGSAAVRFVERDGRIRAEITHSVAMPWRPWHTQRAWSRAARGLPPYRKHKKSDLEEEEAAGESQSTSAPVKDAG